MLVRGQHTLFFQPLTSTSFSSLGSTTIGSRASGFQGSSMGLTSPTASFELSTTTTPQTNIQVTSVSSSITGFQGSSMGQTSPTTTNFQLSTSTTPQTNIQVSLTASVSSNTYFKLCTFTTSFQASSVPPGRTDVSKDSGSQLGAGVGGGVGAVVLLLVVGVVGVGLFCMRRRRHTLKVVLSPAGVVNPVYERKWE